MTKKPPKNGLHTVYHANGQKQVEEDYKNGVCSFIIFPKGKICP